MAHKSTYRVSFRRRKEGKTNYRKRLALLKSGMPRLVARKTGKHVIAQVIEFDPEGDKTLVHVNSRQLEKFGWNFGKKNLPAAYLTGLLAGIKAKEKGIKKAVLDIGFAIPKHKGWWASAAKGFKDAGIEMEVSEEIIPTWERLSGKHVEAFSKKPVTKAFEHAREKIVKEK